MSRNSKKEELRLEQERQNCQRDPQMFYGRVPFMMPIAPPSQMIQLTPIVQPIALVPYSTQQQPISTFYRDDEGMDY